MQAGKTKYDYALGYAYCLSAKLMKDIEPYFRFGK